MVRRFRTVEEMNRAQRPEVETDPLRLEQRIAGLYELARMMCPGLFRGVHKFRTIEEANAFRRTWTVERVQRCAMLPPTDDGSSAAPPST